MMPSAMNPTGNLDTRFIGAGKCRGNRKRIALLVILSCWVSPDVTAWVQEQPTISSLLELQPGETEKAKSLLEHCDPPSLRAVCTKLTAEAVKQHTAGALPRAAFLSWVAAEAARRCNDNALLAQALYELGRVSIDRSDYKAAEDYFAEASRLAEMMGSDVDLLNNSTALAVLYVRQTQYLKAKPIARRCLELALSLASKNSKQSEYGQAVAQRNIGSIAAWEGDTQLAVESFQESIKLFSKLDDSFKGAYKPAIVDGFLGMGLAYYGTGNYAEALSCYTRALNLAENNKYQDRVQAVLNALGLLYIDQGDYSKATSLLDRALQIASKAGDKLGVITISHDLALVDQRRGNYETAIKGFTDVLALAKAGGSPDLVIPPLEGLGSAHHKIGHYQLALEYFGKALDIATQLGDKMRQCEIAWWRASIYYDLRRYEESIHESMRASSLADEISEPNLSYLSLTQLGKSRIATGQFDLAMKDLSRAIERAEQMRGSVGGQQQQRALFFEHKIEPYYLIVDLLVRQAKAGDALLIAERARSRALLDLLGRNSADIGLRLSVTERDEEKRLDAELTALNTQLYRASQQTELDKASLADLKNRLDRARIDYDGFLDRLYASHPELKVTQGRASSFSLADLQSIMPGLDSVVLEFEVLEDKTYVFALSLASGGAPQVNGYAIDVSAKTLAHKVEVLRQRVSNRALGVDKLSAELYSLLVAPAAGDINGKNTLVIVPDAVLWDLPFQALKSNTRYLVEDHSIFYAPSLTALREMMKRKQSTLASATADASIGNNRSPILLAFGNPELTLRQTDPAASYTQNKGIAAARPATTGPGAVAKRDDPLGPLPEAEIEVKTLAKLYGPDRSRVFIGTDATEERAKAEMSQARILHFAAHGILDSANPLYSHIILSQASVSQQGVSHPEVSTDDGLLEAREIMNMNLNSDLAVLSACQTARGRISSGEGVIGMSWAFFAAGCPTTVVSQWSVESQSTTELMIEFHRNLLSGQKMSKAEALRQASLKLLKTEKYRHPFYWAGFIVMGDGR